MAYAGGSAKRFTTKPSMSGSRPSSTGLSARIRLQDSKWRAVLVAPPGLGYKATTHEVTVESMKNARPIGIWKLAHRSSGTSRSGSHRVRLPTGRYSGSPERTFQQLSHVHAI